MPSSTVPSLRLTNLLSNTLVNRDASSGVKVSSPVYPGASFPVITLIPAATLAAIVTLPNTLNPDG